MDRTREPLLSARAFAISLGVVFLLAACATVTEGDEAAQGPSTEAPGSAFPTAVAIGSPSPRTPKRKSNLPNSIDATGSRDVSAELQAFIRNAANGSTIVFKAGGTYRLGTVVRISNKKRITIEGNGATLKLTGGGDYWGSGLYIDQYSEDTTVRDLDIVGNHSAAGTSSTCCSREGQHGIGVHGSSNTLIERVDISRVGGDCFNIKTWYDQPDWAEGVTIRDLSCRLTGRMGVVINGASGVRIVNNVFDDIGYAVFGIEPNKDYQGASDVVIRDNTVGRYSLTDQYKGFLLYACDAPWADGPSTVRDVTLTGNTVAGNPSGKGSDMRGLHVLVCDNGVRANFTVTNNAAGEPVEGPVMRFEGVKGVIVTGNTQPLSSGELASFQGSTGVTSEENDS